MDILSIVCFISSENVNEAKHFGEMFFLWVEQERIKEVAIEGEDAE